MTKNRFTDEQVVRILQEAEVGEKSVTDICRERGITKNTFYAWKKKYGGMNVEESKRLREQTPGVRGSRATSGALRFCLVFPSLCVMMVSVLFFTQASPSDKRSGRWAVPRLV